MSARCQCRGLLWFSSDRLGHTVEHCDGCAYEGPLRHAAALKEPTPPRARKVYGPRNPHLYRCGHERSTSNTYHHIRGWTECRTCKLAGTSARKKARRHITNIACGRDV